MKSVEILVNETTGEVLTTSKEFTIKTSSEEFFLVFFQSLGSLYKLNSAIDIKLLAYLCSNAVFNTCTTYLSATRRKEFMMMNPGITTQTISNSISRLKTLGLLQGDRGEYMINPEVMWKGSVKERDAWMKKDGLQVMIEFKRNERMEHIPVLEESTPAADGQSGTSRESA